MSEGSGRKEHGGVHLVDHLEGLRATDLKEVYAFWSGGDPPELPKRELVRQLGEVMAEEGTVYRRVRTLTRKVIDVLLLFLRRADYRSDLPGLFRRLPGEEHVALEYHEAEAGLKALLRRGFLSESVDRAFGAHGRALYSVPLELGDLLAALFHEETRTVRGVFSLAGHLEGLSSSTRSALRARFPSLAPEAGPDDVSALLVKGGGEAMIAAVSPPALAALVLHVARQDGGFLTRADAAARDGAVPPWDRRAWAAALETAGVGTVARVSLSEYGIPCEDEALVVFHEVLEDVLRTDAPADPAADEVLRAGGDLAADLSAFLAQVRRSPLRMTREGDVHKAARRRIEDGFVSRETGIAGAPEVWAELRAAADHLGLVAVDKEGFLVLREEAERWSSLSLDEKTSALYRLALESPGPRGRSLHQSELRGIVQDLLQAEPERWWVGDSLFVVARQRYLASLDIRKIRDRYRDRHFTAFAAGRESVRDLLLDLKGSWLRRLHVLGVLDVAVTGGAPVAVRLSSLGARAFGVGVPEAPATRPCLVTPDFEVVVLPEGDVADVVHRLDPWGERVRTGDVVHLRFTRESVEAAVAEGRALADLLSFLASHSRGPLPQNVTRSLSDWAAGVSFATLERGVVLRLEQPQTLDKILALPGIEPLLVRRLSPTEALLREEPTDRRLLADLRAEGVYLRKG